jgi:HAD superfamily phosphoserine phosphatase-like hydrolase
MRRMLAVFDIDGTLRGTPDPWLHLHHHLGTAAYGEEFFRKWSAGDISYREMVELDASVWKGFDRASMLQSLESNPIRSGAKHLVKWFSAQRIPCVGISTGLSLFNEITKQELGLEEVVSNDIEFEGEVCKGSVVINVEEAGKADVLSKICQQYQCEPRSAAIVFGDSAADIPMFQIARVAVAVFPQKTEVAEKANLVVDTEPIDRVCKEVERLIA